MKLVFSGQILEKYSNTIFHDSPSSGSRVVRWDQQTHRRRETDMTKLTVACHNFTHGPKWY